MLITDHNHFKVFDKCSNNLAFVHPIGPTALPNGIPHNGTEAGYNGFYWTTGAYAQQNDPGYSILADPRVIFDPITKRFITMATGKANRGIFVGVSLIEDATSWVSITEVPKSVPCPSVENYYLHRGSISTSHLQDQGPILWFIGEMQNNTCSPPDFPRWVVGKVSITILTTPPYSDPNPLWWQETSEEYVAFAPTLAVRVGNNEVGNIPQYAVGFNHITNTLELLALRPTPGALPGSLEAPWRHTITGLPPTLQLPSPLPLTPTPVSSGFQRDIWKAVYRDGFIWAVHCSGTSTPNHSVVRWYKVAMNGWNGPNTTLPQLMDSGTLEPPPSFPTVPPNTFVPSIAVHPAGVVAVTYNSCDLAQSGIRIYSHIKCGHSFPFGPAVMEYDFSSPIYGTGPVLRNQDYAGTVHDPVIPGRFWLHHSIVGDGNPHPPSMVKRFDGCGTDFSGDGQANTTDAIMFYDLLTLGALEADLVPDESVDSYDVEQFLEMGIP